MGHLIVGAEVPDVGETPVAVAGAAGISKGPRLERASAQVPEIIGIGQSHSMRFAAQRKLHHRTQVQRSVDVLIIHHVVEGKARIGAGCCQ